MWSSQKREHHLNVSEMKASTAGFIFLPKLDHRSGSGVNVLQCHNGGILEDVCLTFVQFCTGDHSLVIAAYSLLLYNICAREEEYSHRPAQLSGLGLATSGGG